MRLAALARNGAFAYEVLPAGATWAQLPVWHSAAVLTHALPQSLRRTALGWRSPAHFSQTPRQEALLCLPRQNNRSRTREARLPIHRALGKDTPPSMRTAFVVLTLNLDGTIHAVMDVMRDSLRNSPGSSSKALPGKIAAS
jgi:hypothetical protein